MILYRSEKGIKIKVVVCSAYFQGDAGEARPAQEVRDLISDCKIEGLDLVIGCDVNPHHTMGGASDCNNR